MSRAVADAKSHRRVMPARQLSLSARVPRAQRPSKRWCV